MHSKRNSEKEECLKAPNPKRPCKQPTIHKYFRGESPADGDVSEIVIESAQSSSKNVLAYVAERTPEFLGIRVYTREQIEEITGLQQDFKQFWNEKAVELCRDQSVCGKLQGNKTAIQGAIHTSWILHKTSLLELKAEKLQEDLKMVYHDHITYPQISG